MIIYTGVKSSKETAITALSGKVFPGVAPENQPLPYCTYKQIFETNIKTLDGYDGEASIDFQIDFFSSTYISAKSYAATYKDYIKNHTGSFGDATLQDVEILNEQDETDMVSSKINYRTIIDIRFTCIP